MDLLLLLLLGWDWIGLAPFAIFRRRPRRPLIVPRIVVNMNNDNNINVCSGSFHRGRLICLFGQRNYNLNNIICPLHTPSRSQIEFQGITRLILRRFSCCWLCSCRPTTPRHSIRWASNWVCSSHRMCPRQSSNLLPPVALCPPRDWMCNWDPIIIFIIIIIGLRFFF